VAERALSVCLGGDVMTGRGMDQILAHPGKPELREPAARDAREYVRMAERVHGPIPRGVEAAWPWGDAMRVLETAEVRIVNLETAITTSDAFAPGKVVHYRMHPANVPCLTAAGIEVCALANNHVLDFGVGGLLETLDALRAAGLRTAGAGRTAGEAAQPAVVPVTGGRVVVLATGMESSGIPPAWAAGERPGVDLLPGATAAGASRMLERVHHLKRPGDVVVVSIHWGPNWGYEVSESHVRFAHRLVDGGVDVVHGHSSHHPRPIDVYRDRLILSGCGDLVDDYEGIPGREEYRSDLRLLYLASLEPASGRLLRLHALPFQSRAMRLSRASPADTARLGDVLTRVSRPFGTRSRPSTHHGMLTVDAAP
jgi:poly-gamma-glutamate capsule biosynthesis protein CapA/YwtB (metallophosphatase superfamily)